MSFSVRYSAERNVEFPVEMERIVHDNGSVSGGTFLQAEYRPSCAY